MVILRVMKRKYVGPVVTKEKGESVGLKERNSCLVIGIMKVRSAKQWII